MSIKEAAPSAGANAGGHREEGRSCTFNFDSTKYEPFDGSTIPQPQNEVSEEVRTNPRLQEALKLASQGALVFPCREKTTQKGKVKAPYTARGHHDATTDESQIIAWWKRWPEAMIGVVPGGNVFLFDIDVHEVNGFETLEQWEAAYGPLPMTATYITPTGGQGRLFRTPDDLPVPTTSDSTIGIDSRGDGTGYFIAPPSTRYDLDPPGQYRWLDENAQIATAPQWLVDKLRAKSGGAASCVGDINIYDRKLRQEDYEYLKQLRNDPVWNGTTDQDNMRHHGGEKDDRWNSEAELFVAKAVRKKVGRDDGALIFRLTCASPVIQEKIECSAAEEKRIPKRIAKYTIPTACAHVAEEEADALRGKELGGSLLTGVTKVDITQGTARPQPVPQEASFVRKGDFPVDALGRILGPAAWALFEVYRVDPAVCGQCLLAAASLAVQPYFNVEIDGRVYPTTLFAMTLAESGGRKTSIDKVVLMPHRERVKELNKVYKQQKDSYDIAKAAYDKRVSEATKSMSQLGNSADDRGAFEQHLREIGPAPNKPVPPNLMSAEPTYEGVVNLVRAGAVNFGIFSDEGGRFLTGYAMNKDNALKTAGALSNLWDGSVIESVRAGSDPFVCEGRRVALHLMAQPGVLTGAIKSDEFFNQGILNRYLYVWAENQGAVMYQSKNALLDPRFIAYKQLTSDYLRTPYPFATDESGHTGLASSPEARSLAPTHLHLTNEAKERWIQYYNDIQAKMEAGGEHEAYRGYAAKLPEQVLRVAGVLAAYDRLRELNLDVVVRSIRLMGFYWNEAVRFFSSLKEQAAESKALAVHKWIVKKGGRVGRTFLIKYVVPATLRKAAEIDPIIDELCSQGWIVDEGAGSCEIEVKGQMTTVNYRTVYRAIEIPK